MSNFDDPTPEQIAKLPKWAQSYIQRTENLLRRSQGELEALRSGSLVNAERQKFYVDNFEGQSFWLPQYARLAFKQDPTTSRSTPDFSIRESDDKLGGVEVNCSVNGRLAVLPKASNVVQLVTLNY